MLKKRIIPCLDVKDGAVVKGVQFRNHEIVGEIIELAKRYSDSGADELVFYDITASSDNRNIDKKWIYDIAKNINIPFCVAGGIRSVAQAEAVLANGADKISINSPALENPQLITELAKRFGTQCVVVGIDSRIIDGQYQVNQYTGDESKTVITSRSVSEWAAEVESRGAGEIVLNCMNQDGVRSGYDIIQTKLVSNLVNIPVIASGGAGSMSDFANLFKQTRVTGALAASVFHKQIIAIDELKQYLAEENIEIRKC
jgi:cyclase